MIFFAHARAVFRFLPFLMLASCLFCAAPAGSGDSQPEMLMNAGHWKKARSLVEALAAAHPNDANTAFLLSRVRLAFKDFDAALRLAERAVALDSNNPRYHWQLGAVCGEITGLDHLGLFQRLSLGKRFKNENRRATALDARFAEPHVALIGFDLRAPGIAGGDKNEAERLATELTKMERVEGLLAQAEIAETEKDSAKAESLYLEAVRGNGGSYEARLALATFYLSQEQRRYDLGEKYAREGLALDPARSDAYSALARAYAAESHWTQLQEILTLAEKNNPDDLDAYYQAGKQLLLSGGDMGRAESFFRAYLRQEAEGHRPDLASAHWRLGLVLEREGRKRDAASEIETAIQLNPRFEQAKKDFKRVK